MAPSTAYLVWFANGSPYRLMRPAAALQRILRGHRLTVYDYPDQGHLRASKPEDHTPFSATGWPVKSAFGVGHALDVMPRTDTPAGRAENAAIARQLIKDRDAGVSGVLWIKYINWTDEQGVCRQERWMDAARPLARTTRPSTDKGHIHISGRSDCDNDARAEGYDPLSEGNPFMALTDQQQNDLWEWIALLVDPGTPPGGRPGDRFHFPPTLMQVRTKIDALLAAAAADEARDQATLAAVQALTVATGLDPAPILTAIADARTETHDLVVQLQQQLQRVEARNGRLAAALAAAGGALEDADDDPADGS